MNNLLFFDAFGHPIEIGFKGQVGTYKTPCGVFMTLIYIAILIASSSKMIINMLSWDNANISSRLDVISDNDFQNATLDKFQYLPFIWIRSAYEGKETNLTQFFKYFKLNFKITNLQTRKTTDILPIVRCD